ncbi:MAG TPA: hypothetical protein VJN88_12940 [Ktedonobacterales bacterium]|nr:hypothetical protein [Ktedonobacterales bacterium]
MREAARRFGVAVTTVKRAIVQQRETWSLERKPIPGCPRRIGQEQESHVACAAGGDARRHRVGALRVVGVTAGPAAERGDDVAGDSSPRLDA